jgi:hypothetical protein
MTIESLQDRAPKSLSGSPWAQMLATLLPWQEIRYAKRTSRDLLELYRAVVARYPGMPRREIYRRVVMAHTGAGPDDAGSILLQAERSFASWPTDRDLTFTDVAHYLVVSQYLADEKRVATRTDMGRAVASQIPKDL